MNKLIAIMIVFLFLSLSTAYSQDNIYHSIQEAINHHIQELESNVGQYDRVFLMTNLSDSLKLSKKVFAIEGEVNPKFLNEKDKYFLVQIKIAVESNCMKIDMINYKILKVSNKKLNLVNLSNGHSYIIR